MDPCIRRRSIVKEFGADPAEFSADVLQTIATGPIMDPNRIYLPAGRISVAECRAREAANIIEGSL